MQLKLTTFEKSWLRIFSAGNSRCSCITDSAGLPEKITKMNPWPTPHRSKLSPAFHPPMRNGRVFGIRHAYLASITNLQRILGSPLMAKKSKWTSPQRLRI
jgi:hypothetical protein